MRKLLIFIFLCFSLSGLSQSVQDYMQDASYFESTGQFQEALKSYQKAMESLPVDSSYLLASVLNNCANIYVKNGYKSEARILYRQAERKLSIVVEDERVELLQGKLFLNIGNSLLADSGQHAVPYLTQAAKILAHYPEEKQSYMQLLTNLGNIEEDREHYQDAYLYFKGALKEQSLMVGDDSPELLLPLMNVATCLYNMSIDSTSEKSIHDALPYIEQYVHILRGALAENLNKMNEAERRTYWDMQQRALYNATQIVAYSAYLSRNDRQENATRLLLDIVLLRKSLLLDASLNSHNPQGELSYLNITSQQLQKELLHNEKVVEIVKVGNELHNEYLAIVVSHRGAPRLVPLLGLSAFLSSHVGEHTVLNDRQLNQLMWQPLLADTKLPSVVYLVPDGQLQMIPVEYALQDRYRVCERYEVRRLTSSKQLLLRRDKGISVLSQPCLIGGCQYNAKQTDIEMEAGSNFHIDQLPTSPNPQLISAIENEYFFPLPGTVTETKNIDSILHEAKYPVRTYLGVSAHKNSLADAQNYSPTLLHIATHGLFLPSVKYDMHQSGLVFSGANTLPDRTQAIMTAEEISKLHFPDLQLVVLSACHAGQGNVTDEGVWGLQRACKMTGCRAMILTLWEVNDEATQVMMTQMYQHLVAGKDIYTSFASAIAYIRQQSFIIDGQPISGNSPDIWCAYILVDAI